MSYKPDDTRFEIPLGTPEPANNFIHRRPKKTATVLVSLVLISAVLLCLWFFVIRDDWPGIEMTIGFTEKTVYIQPRPEVVSYARCWVDDIDDIKDLRSLDDAAAIQKSIDNTRAKCDTIERPSPRQLWEYSTDREDVLQVTNWGGCANLYATTFNSIGAHSKGSWEDFLESLPVYYRYYDVRSEYAAIACEAFSRRDSDKERIPPPTPLQN